MKQITLHRIKCIDTEDFFRDELLLKVFIDGWPAFQLFDEKMHAGETWALNKTFEFEHHIQLFLTEKRPGTDTSLGQIIIFPNDANNAKIHFEPSPFSDYRLTYSVADKQCIIKHHDRVLLAAAELTNNLNDLQSFGYTLKEGMALSLAENVAGRMYGHYHSLSDADLTVTNFVGKLAELATNPNNKAVDVILCAHGSHECLYFTNGESIMACDLAQKIREAIPDDDDRQRLRMIWSSACHGLSHVDNWIDAGFKVASGARASNVGGPSELGYFLYQWARNKKTFAEALGYPAAILKVQDMIAALKYPNLDIDSRKGYQGDGEINIESCPL